LSPFFRTGRRKKENGEEVVTNKKALRDIRGLERGTRQGKVIIENIKPKLVGGKKEIVDETFTDDVKYKETDEGEFKE